MINNIAKSAGTILTGTVIGQFIVLAASPLLSRLYSPEEFGEFALFAVILYAFMAISCGRYDAALIITKTTREAHILARASGIICGTTSIIVFFTLFAAQYFSENEFLHTLLITLPICIFLAGINTIQLNLQLRRHKTRTVAISRTLQSSVACAIQIGAGCLKSGAYGLITGQAAGLVASTIQATTRKQLKSLARFQRRDWIKTLRKFSSFPKYEMWSALQTVANNHMPTLLIGLFAGAAYAGAFAFAQRIVTTPLSLVASAISSSILAYSRIENAKKENIIFEIIDRLSATANTLLTIVGTLFIYTFGDIFGERWEFTGVIAAWVCLSASTKFKLDATFTFTTTNNKQKDGLIIQTILSTFRAALLLILLKTVGVIEAIIFYCLASSLINHIASQRIQKQIKYNGSKKDNILFFTTMALSSITILSAQQKLLELNVILLAVNAILLYKNTHSLVQLRRANF